MNVMWFSTEKNDNASLKSNAENWMALTAMMAHTSHWEASKLSTGERIGVDVVVCPTTGDANSRSAIEFGMVDLQNIAMRLPPTQ